MEIEIRNPGILAGELEKKFIILDIRAKDQKGNQYDIEMQVRRYDNYPKRTLYYLTRMYANQLKSGQDYLKLKPVIGIHFLDYVHFDDHPDFHYRFSFKDSRYPELIFTDDLTFHLLELPGMETRMKDWKGEPLSEWLHFFNHAHEEGDKTMQEQYTNPRIRKAFDVLNTISMDEKERRIAEMRERALKDEVSFLASARREGLEKGNRDRKIKTAIKLIRKGSFSIEEIAELVELSVDEIEQLQKELPES